MKVFVLNHYGGNKGDRAVLYFIVRELLRNRIEEISVSVHDRSFWTNAGSVFNCAPSQITFVPWGWNVEGFSKDNPEKNFFWWKKQRIYRDIFLPLVRNRMLKKKRSLGYCRFFCQKDFLRQLQSADLVMSTGGHHITTRFHPNAKVEMVYDMMLAAMSKKNFVIWSHSIGPLDFTEPEMEQAVRNLLESTSEIIVRESKSIDVLKQFGVALNNVRQTSESVFGLNDEIRDFTPPSKREKTLGITIYNAEARTQEEYREYVKTIAFIADYAISKGLTVKFFPHEMKQAVVDDRACIRDVMNLMEHSNNCVLVDEDLSTVEHLKELAKCRMFIGHKTHSVVFSLTVGTPLIALSYHPKTSEFMNEYSLSDFTVTDEKLSRHSLKNTFDNLLEKLDKVAEQAFSISREKGEKVRSDFAEMLRRWIIPPSINSKTQ